MKLQDKSCRGIRRTDSSFIYQTAKNVCVVIFLVFIQQNMYGRRTEHVWKENRTCMEGEPPNGLPTGIHLSTGAGHLPAMFA